MVKSNFGFIIFVEVGLEIISWIADKVTGVPGHDFRRDFKCGKPNKESEIK
jgi:hypothetical protein